MYTHLNTWVNTDAPTETALMASSFVPLCLGFTVGNHGSRQGFNSGKYMHIYLYVYTHEQCASFPQVSMLRH